jgi:hypothetical protein
MSRRSKAAGLDRKAQSKSLRAEGHALWAMKGVRIKQSLGVNVLAIATMVGGGFLHVPALVWVSIPVFLVGIALMVDGYRFERKADLVDLQMRRLDPEDRLLSSWPEEIGRGIRARLDERSGGA